MAPAATMGHSRGAGQVQAVLAAIWPRDRRGVEGHAALLSPLPCYRFDSWLRSVGGGLGQFWPHIEIIVRPQDGAGDYLAREPFNGHALLKGNTAHLPVTQCAHGDIQMRREDTSAIDQAGRPINWMFIGQLG